MYSPLNLAVLHGHLNIVKMLIERKGINVNITGKVCAYFSHIISFIIMVKII